ncbi:hypothetical protein [Methylobacterium brachythecii]|uniref:Uncharacterized protein n=1 Tax=Methylobacterium brachythecii TaxID=1176177 RepID=A0A7W6F8B6_9HYPH|nr:hypothetical protein [Methylobacterium brachythecii]MBB3904235.1 hypothetical protein [Methylobacterium brachythecii]GLS45103.1 hypothetical protein GCM10007884_30920 [Methylobacterium brachythecii]
MFERPLTVTELVNAQIYEQDRKASRGRVGRQNGAAKRQRLTGTQACFLPIAERDVLAMRLRALVAQSPLDLNADRALRLIVGAEPSYRLPGCAALLLTHRDAVLLGNVMRRMGGELPSLARIDAIACRDERKAS